MKRVLVVAEWLMLLWIGSMVADDYGNAEGAAVFLALLYLSNIDRQTIK